MATARPRVSFVMSCNSYGRFLGVALDSLLGQTLRDIEVIVIDDASTDETAAVLARYEAADDRVWSRRHDERRGHIRSNNEGVGLARGEFVGTFDSDDFLLRPDAVAREVAIFDREPRVGLVYTAYLLVDDDGKPFRTFRPWETDYVRSGREEFKHLVRALYVPHSGTLVRRSLHVSTDIYDPALPYSADWDIWLRLCKLGDVGYISDCLMAYRQHQWQMSQQRFSPRAATDNLVRTLEKAFDGYEPELGFDVIRLRKEATSRALLHQTRMDRSLGRIRRAWSGLGDAVRRSPHLLVAGAFYWDLARLAAVTVFGHTRYVRLVSMRDRLAGGKAPVA